jgi:hypothetical protein
LARLSSAPQDIFAYVKAQRDWAKRRAVLDGGGAAQDTKEAKLGGRYA